jgi:hypothetical protein
MPPTPKPRDDDGGYDSGEVDDDTINDIAARYGYTNADGEAAGSQPMDRPD